MVIDAADQVANDYGFVLVSPINKRITKRDGALKLHFNLEIISISISKIFLYQPSTYLI